MAKPKKKPPIGRPLLRGEKMTVTSLKLPPTQRDAYVAAAEAAGVTLGEWLRQAADEKLKRG